MTQTNEQILLQYISLLNQQYCGQTSPQSLNFSTVPARGVFTITFGTLLIGPIAWNASQSDVQNAFSNLVTSISSDPNNPDTYSTQFPYAVTISGSPATFISVDFGNNTPIILGVTSNSLFDTNSIPVSVVTSGDLVKAAMTIQGVSKLSVMNQLPAIIQDAFNLIPTVQTISFSGPLTTGTFKILLSVTSTPSVANALTAAINWNDDNQTVTNKINAILPSGFVTVVGWTFTFSNVNPTILSVQSNTTGLSTVVRTNLAFGSQLDTLAKYAGVSRNGAGPIGPITLSDSDLYTLIQLGIIRNNFGSSLYDIDNLLYTFFQNNIRVFDNNEMQLSYTVNGSYFSSNLLECMVSQRLFPRPMGVQLASIIPVPTTGFFSFCDAKIPTNRTGPGFNDVTGYVLTSPWLSAGDIV